MSGWNWGDTISALIGTAGFLLAWRTYYVQNLKEEVIVYPYQEQYGEYGIAIENIGKSTAVDYTFKVLSYDPDTTEMKKKFLSTYKLLNKEARITLAIGKVHKIRIGDQKMIPEEIIVKTSGESSGPILMKEGEYPTLEIEILKKKGNTYSIINYTTCDFKAFEEYPFTSHPIDLLKYQISRDNQIARAIAKEQNQL